MPFSGRLFWSEIVTRHCRDGGGEKDVTGFRAWEEAEVPQSNLRQPGRRKPLRALGLLGLLHASLPGLCQGRLLLKPGASEEEPPALSTVRRWPAQDARKSAASSRRPAPSRPLHSRCSRPWRPLQFPGSGPGLPPPVSPRASQPRPRPQPRTQPPAAASTAAPASPPGSASADVRCFAQHTPPGGERGETRFRPRQRPRACASGAAHPSPLHPHPLP